MERIVLASQSARRKQLLEWAEIPFDVIVKDTDESYPEGLHIEDIPVFIARNKAMAVRKELSHDRTILAADTVVVLDDEIIGKPEDREDAIDILKRLEGRTHLVITGVVILKGDKEIAFFNTTEVNFNSLTFEDIAFYIDKYKPYDKAGAYAIQEWIGVVGIESIKGDFYNVMGLPVNRVVRELNKLI